MPDRAAIVTGASSGIGLGISRVLGEEGYGLTVAARRPEKLTAAAEELRGARYDVQEVAAPAPGFVETPMTEFVREHVPAEDMIRVEDVAEAVRFVLRTSPNCVIPEIVFQRPGEAL